MKSDLRIENLDVTELEHRLEMALSSPILSDKISWELKAEGKATWEPE